MQKQPNLLIAPVIFMLLMLNSPSSLAQEKEPIRIDAFAKIKSRVILLDDGQNQAYGLYLARSKNKKFMYVLSTNNLAIGIEKKIRGTLLDGKIKELKAERLSANETFNMAIYQLESPPKEMTTFTRFPKDSLQENTEVWALGNLEKPNRLTVFEVDRVVLGEKVISLTGNLEQSFLGSPLFDSQGRIIGCLADTSGSSRTRQQAEAEIEYQVISISALLEYATNALHGLDLYPIWKEVYPTDFIINQTQESVALLDTKKGGAGIFLGRDKSGNGYILTAYHVVSDDAAEFSVHFVEHFEERLLGKTMRETIDEDQDLAIVNVGYCPEIKPALFWRNDSLEKLEKFFIAKNIATIGYDEETFWRYKFGQLVSTADKTVHTNLAVKSGDSGGPIFNEKGEVLGLNLKTAGYDSVQQAILSVCANSRAILKYLDDKLGKIDFVEKWGFHEYPSFWRKNLPWLLPASAATIAGVSSALLTREKKESLAGRPEFP